MIAILTVQNVEKSFGARRVLAGVSFAVHDKDRIGLVGLNGSGKSTLLKLLSGIGTEEDPSADGPDTGLLTRRRDLHVEYVSQEPKLPPEHSVQQALRDGLRAHSAVLAELETLGQQIERLDGNKRDAALVQQAALHERLEELGGWDVEHEIRGLAAALQLPPLTALVGSLSIGERRRVALAAALLARPELLLLDEPTNHLDTRTVEWLETRLRTQPGALVLVTHDRYFLDRVANRIMELDRGHLYSYDGNYRKFLEKQAERLDNEQSREHERAMFVRREIDWIRRGPQARATKQKARIDRFYEAVAEKPGIDERSPMDRKMMLRLPTGGRIGKTIMEMRGLSKSLGGKLLFSDLTLILKPGDRIGIVGGNGAGKTTLVRTLLGEIPPDAGEVITGINTRIAFLDQGRAELNDEKSVLQEVAGDSDTVLLEDGPVHVRSFLRMMLFDDRFADAKVGTLSGGERNRVQLAKLLRRGGNLLVLDEPTNDLDLMTLGVLEQALVEFPGCVLVVSHDRWFLDTVATAILAFGGDGQVTFYEGNYTDYLTKAREAEKQAAAALKSSDKAAAVKSAAAAKPAVAVKPVVADKPAAADKNAGRRLSFNEQRELGTIEEKIATAESTMKALQEKLNEPTLYRERAAEVPGLVAELEAARTAVERLYARWQELDALPKK